MPAVSVDCDALAHNLRAIRHLTRQWGVAYLPVLKAVSNCPAVVDELRRLGIAAIGVAEVEEAAFSSTKELDVMLISIPPPSRLNDVVRRFRRSPLHADAEDMTCLLPGAFVSGPNSNYTVLDVTDCARPPRVGDSVHFRPGYWAMARAFRNPAVKKDVRPGQALAPRQEAV